MQNKIRLDYANNPELAEVFSKKKAGDKCTLEVTFQIDEIDAKMAAGSIEKISPDDYKKEDAVEPEPGKPMMIEMTMSKDMGKLKKDEPA